MKARVVIAVSCLFLAKAANVGTPPILGYAVDSLTELSEGINVYMLIPLALIISYGIARIAALGFGELRNAIFSKVAQNAITQLTLNTFKHLHSLSLYLIANLFFESLMLTLKLLFKEKNIEWFIKLMLHELFVPSILII